MFSTILAFKFYIYIYIYIVTVDVIVDANLYIPTRAT